MLNSSFVNIPLMQDQDLIDIKCPMPIDEQLVTMQPKQLYTQKKYFPTSAMYNRQSNFQRFDLESLFFSFYYMQGSYQQYLAAVELKKRGWDFHIRFQTWIKKEVVQEPNRFGKHNPKTKTLYFDFENEWKIRTFNNNEIQIEDPKISS